MKPKTIKRDCIRVKTPLDKLKGRAEATQAQRERKLAEARQARKALRKASWKNQLDRHEKSTDNTKGWSNGHRHCWRATCQG